MNKGGQDGPLHWAPWPVVSLTLALMERWGQTILVGGAWEGGSVDSGGGGQRNEATAVGRGMWGRGRALF